MNVEYINPLIEASVDIIKQTTKLTPKLGKIFVKNDASRSDNLLILIGLTGKIQGSVVITFDAEVSCMIASAMMGGMPVQNLDEISKSAIAELCNMILGNTATLYSKKNINIDITPPTILTGERIQISAHKSLAVCIPLIFDNGLRIEVDISYIEK